MQDDKPGSRTTRNNGWRAERECWRDGILVGWIGRCFDEKTLAETGFYAQATNPLRFVVKNVPEEMAAVALENAVGRS